MKLKLVFSLMVFYFASFIASQNIARAQEPYINKRFGFEVQNPDGWIKPIETLLKDGNMKISFGKSKAEALPGIVVTTDFLGQFDNLLDYTNFVIQRLKDLYANAELEMNILEEPREVEMRGLKGIRYVYKVAGPVTIKFIDYKFMRAPVVVSFSGSDMANNFNKSSNDFERIVASFKFIEKEKEVVKNGS